MSRANTTKRLDRVLTLKKLGETQARQLLGEIASLRQEVLNVQRQLRGLTDQTNDLVRRGNAQHLLVVQLESFKEHVANLTAKIEKLSVLQAEMTQKYLMQKQKTRAGKSWKASSAKHFEPQKRIQHNLLQQTVSSPANTHNQRTSNRQEGIVR